jgi:hypothetical protein
MQLDELQTTYAGTASKTSVTEPLYHYVPITHGSPLDVCGNRADQPCAGQGARTSWEMETGESSSSMPQIGALAQAMADTEKARRTCVAWRIAG